MSDIALLLVLLAVFVLPLALPRVEHNLEVFLLGAGTLSAIIAGVLNAELVGHALREPIAITAAVIVAGLLFKWFRDETEAVVLRVARRVSLPVVVGMLVWGLSLLSSVITAIIASLFLASFVHALRVHRRTQAMIAIPGCFGIAFGSILTPIGEPLATIVTAKLDVNFWFLAQTFWPVALIGTVSAAGIAAVGMRRLGAVTEEAVRGEVAGEGPEDSYREVAARAARVYGFVVGLGFLGTAYATLVDRYVAGASAPVLYVAGLSSAVLDNATLASAAVSPLMPVVVLKAFVISLIISGGMLIPGNIPNIVSAGRLHIGSLEWARVAVPIGLAYLLAFAVLLAFENLGAGVAVSGALTPP